MDRIALRLDSKQRLFANIRLFELPGDRHEVVVRVGEIDRDRHDLNRQVVSGCDAPVVAREIAGEVIDRSNGSVGRGREPEEQRGRQAGTSEIPDCKLHMNISLRYATSAKIIP